MRILIVSALLGLSGCRTAAPIAPLPLPLRAVPEPKGFAASPPPPPAGPSIAKLERQVREQTKFIEALISQNDALAAKLAAQPPLVIENPPTPATPHPAMPDQPPTPVQPPAPPPEQPTGPTPPPPVTPTPAPAPAVAAVEPCLMPNAEGVIDLTIPAIPANPDEPINPFAVRIVPAESRREIILHVGGIVAGPVACAVINERLFQAGEAVESLAIERIERDAVFLRHGSHRLKLPVSDKPARVRLAL